MGYDWFQEIREEIGDVERMLKAMIKSQENKHLNPGPLGPFFPTYWEKNHILLCVIAQLKPCFT